MNKKEFESFTKETSKVKNENKDINKLVEVKILVPMAETEKMLK